MRDWLLYWEADSLSVLGLQKAELQMNLVQIKRKCFHSSFMYPSMARLAQVQVN